MSDLLRPATREVPSGRDVDLDITVRTGSGSGLTPLAAFDQALMAAGVANFNLVTLSSVIPARSVIRRTHDAIPGEHGDRLFCVMSRAWADHPGDIAWCGLGWVRRDDGRGLFVEHHGGSAASVVEQIQLSLTDMSLRRGGGFGQIEHALSSVHYVDRPVCALALAAYQVVDWSSP